MTIAALLFALIASPNLDESRAPILLDFQAEWCGPCKQMRPAIKLLVDRGYPVKEIDVDKSPELASRFRVSNVPTFIVVDRQGREVARTEGFQPAEDLARFYREAKAQLKPQRDEIVEADANATGPGFEVVDDRGQEPAAADPADTPQTRSPNPEPWKTVVRIKVKGNGSIGFGSGTIIYSNAEESIILTCAHIFKIDGRAPSHPSRFPLPIEVDLFDGQLHSKETPRVHFAESVKGEAMDYDFNRDVGLIRIRPGRRLEASRVVPPDWKAQPNVKMTTVGCSEGHDATAWTTRIVNPSVKLFANSNADYEAIECLFAPKQGRSGGGLYTLDGFVAGVCDFAEPQGNHGFYATPRSIYKLLDRNKLTALYMPSTKPGGALLAESRPTPRRSSNPPSIARAQSPDSEDAGKILMPPPGMFGIKDPQVVAQNPAPRRKVGAQPSWRPGAVEGGQSVARRELERAESTDLMIAEDATNDSFGPQANGATGSAPAPAPEESASSSDDRFKGKWRAIRSPSAPMLSVAGDR